MSTASRGHIVLENRSGAMTDLQMHEVNSEEMEALVFNMSSL